MDKTIHAYVSPSHTLFGLPKNSFVQCFDEGLIIDDIDFRNAKEGVEFCDHDSNSTGTLEMRNTALASNLTSHVGQSNFTVAEGYVLVPHSNSAESRFLFPYANDIEHDPLSIGQRFWASHYYSRLTRHAHSTFYEDKEYLLYEYLQRSDFSKHSILKRTLGLEPKLMCDHLEELRYTNNNDFHWHKLSRLERAALAHIESLTVPIKSWEPFMNCAAKVYEENNLWHNNYILSALSSRKRE